MVVFAIPFFLSACNYDNCSSRLGFNLDYHLFTDVKIAGTYYCGLVNGALDGDKEAIINLSKVAVYDFASYQHGAVLIEVIDRITERRYVEIIKPVLTEKEIRKVASYLMGGLDFTDNTKYTRKTFAQAFPLLKTYDPTLTE